MGQAQSVLSYLLGVSPLRHRSFAETAIVSLPSRPSTGSQKTKSVTESNVWGASTEKNNRQTKKDEKDRSVSFSALFSKSKPDSGRMLSEPAHVSKSWLGPTPSDTKTAISSGPDKFQIPHNKDDMVAEDCSKYDTVLMMPATESQIFKLKEDKALSGKDTTLLTPPKKKQTTKKSTT